MPLGVFLKRAPQPRIFPIRWVLRHQRRATVSSELERETGIGFRRRDANAGLDLPNGVGTKKARWSSAADQLSNAQRLKCRRNIYSQFPRPQGGTSGEQQIKLSSADKADVSNIDPRVVGRARFPRLQVSSDIIHNSQSRRRITIGHHRS